MELHHRGGGARRAGRWQLQVLITAMTPLYAQILFFLRLKYGITFYFFLFMSIYRAQKGPWTGHPCLLCMANCAALCEAEVFLQRIEGNVSYRSCLHSSIRFGEWCSRDSDVDCLLILCVMYCMINDSSNKEHLYRVCYWSGATA